MRLGFSSGIDRLAGLRIPPTFFFLLLEGGDRFLLESGDKILLEF